MQKYPIPAPHHELHLTGAELTLMLAKRGVGLPAHHLGMEKYRQWHLSRLAADYLLLCDGTRSHKEICTELALPFRVVGDRLASYLETETGVIYMADSPDPDPPRVFVTGSFQSYAPLHMSVEITDTCNFRCNHCYVSASPEKLARREAEDLFTLFNSMRANGVRVVELTGGECTTHPDFREILAHAAETFHLVAVVTNGFLAGTREGLAEWIGKHGNVCAQVSIDGNEQFHDEFRRKKGSYSAALEAVRRFKAQDMVVRVAMSATQENVEHAGHVFQVAKSLGADAFSVAPVTGFGRGAEVEGCGSGDRALQRRIAEILAPHASDPMFDSNRIATQQLSESSHKNCGAGWRSFGLNGATGEVRSCLYLADSKKFGSVDRVPYSDIFEQPELRMFRDAPSPSSGLDTCRDCRHISECAGCFAKAFRVSETEYPECRWRERYFPGMSLAPSAEGQPRLIQLRLPSGTSGSISESSS